ncbi:chitinase [Enterobacter sp.]|uniref:chitinase n=1 Tax=Enterobacter sp. TaxID=42895 RepID=UPI00296E4F76|nr:chitinase [Enterobacter sp.]
MSSQLTIKTNKIDAFNWYQKVVVTITNTGTQAADLNRATLSFSASGHPDPWGVFDGSLIGNQPLTLNNTPQGVSEDNEIIINNSTPLMLKPGASGKISFSLAASSVPLLFDNLTLRLANEADSTPIPPVDEPEPVIPAPEEEPTPEPEEIPETPVEPLDPVMPIEPVTGSGISLSHSSVNSNSWYQRLTFTLTNGYNQPVDINKLAIHFTASARPDIYSPFTGSLAGNQAPTFTSDGGWPIQKNGIIINNNGPLWLAAGASGTLECALAATQTPVQLTDISAMLASDPGSQGTLAVSFPALSATAGLLPTFTLTRPDGSQKSYTGAWGETQIIDGLSRGEYRLNVDTLENATLKLTPKQAQTAITLASSNDRQQCQIDWLPAVYYADVELTLAAAPDLEGGCVQVELRQHDAVVRTVTLTFGATTTVNKLVAGERYDIALIPTTINNVQIVSPLFGANFIAGQNQRAAQTVHFQQQQVNTANFVEVQATILGLPSGTPGQRYRFTTASGSIQYIVMLSSDTAKQKLPLRFASGQYSVPAMKVSQSGAIYQSAFPTTLTLAQSKNVITLPFEKGVHLQVRGWPAYLAHGGVTVNASSSVSAYAGVPVDALFKYDGFDGGGDPIPAAEVDANGDGFLDLNLLPIHKTMDVARKIEKEAGRPVMPVMVVYTANASGGSALPDLQDIQKLRNHFGNFITQCVAAQSYKDADHPVPATFVMNPDFLGAMQQEPYGYTAVRAKNSMQVNQQLAEAVNALAGQLHYSVPVLPRFSDDLYGYLQAMNYVKHQFAPDVPFGWQTNVWATGSADWLLRDNADPSAQAQQIVAFIDELGVYKGNYVPDFIVFDKFERDCFSPDALAHYGWNATCWFNYLNMVKGTASGLNIPAMIWQIPGGHMPTREEGTSLITSSHFASGGTFLMGDARIGSSISAITPALTTLALNRNTYGAATVGEFLLKDNGYDWGQMQAKNLPEYNIFSVLWGGGSTVSLTTIGSNGDDGGWLAEKMREYAASPRFFI